VLQLRTRNQGSERTGIKACISRRKSANLASPGALYIPVGVAPQNIEGDRFAPDTRVSVVFYSTTMVQ